MRHSRSGVHESSSRPDESTDPRSASIQVHGDQQKSKFHLRRLMDTIRLDELVEQTPEAVAMAVKRPPCVGPLQDT
jgi:hypothetical protein